MANLYTVMLDIQRLEREMPHHGKGTHADLARAVGMTPQQWHNLIVKNRGRSLTLKTLNRIAKRLKIPAKELLK